jgi:hypothetical protein
MMPLLVIAFQKVQHLSPIRPGSGRQIELAIASSEASPLSRAAFAIRPQHRQRKDRMRQPLPVRLESRPSRGVWTSETYRIILPRKFPWSNPTAYSPAARGAVANCVEIRWRDLRCNEIAVQAASTHYRWTVSRDSKGE